VTDDKQKEQPANENERRSEDELWKEFLSVSFYNMLRSVLPDLANVADTTKPVRFLETEVRRLARFTRRYSANQADQTEGVYRWEGFGSEVTLPRRRNGHRRR